LEYFQDSGYLVLGREICVDGHLFVLLGGYLAARQRIYQDLPIAQVMED
jgi:hypothetical protein